MWANELVCRFSIEESMYFIAVEIVNQGSLINTLPNYIEVYSAPLMDVLSHYDLCLESVIVIKIIVS